jgi:chromosome segregation ATPase
MSLTKLDLDSIRGVVVDAINESFEALSAPRFDALEDRMDSLETRMGSLETRVDSLETKVGSVENRLGSLETNQIETNRRLTAIEQRLDSIESELETLRNDVMALYKLVGQPKVLPQLGKSYASLTTEDKVRALQSYTLELAKKLNITL